MCLPVAIALPLAAMAVGTVMQYAGQQKADHALSNTFNREEARQKAFQAEQNARFQDSLDGTASNLADPNAQAAAAAKREAVLSSATKSADPAASGYLPGSSTGNAVVNAAAVNAGKKADATTAGLGAALASMGGLSDLFQQNDIRLGHNSQAIDQIANFAAGSRDALQPEMDAAKQKGGTLRMLGGLAQSIGQAFLAGGAGGISAPSIAGSGTFTSGFLPVAGAAMPQTDWGSLFSSMPQLGFAR